MSRDVVRQHLQLLPVSCFHRCLLLLSTTCHLRNSLRKNVKQICVYHILLQTNHSTSLVLFSIGSYPVYPLTFEGRKAVEELCIRISVRSRIIKISFYLCSEFDVSLKHYYVAIEESLLL